MSPPPAALEIVPRRGNGRLLTVFCAAVMACLGVVALAAAGAAGRTAADWRQAVTGSATVQVLGTGAGAEADAARLLAILDTTPGVLAARRLSPADLAALMAPWFGDLPGLDGLPLPPLIAVETGPGFDAAGLRFRLTGEVADAVLDDHASAVAPVLAAADRLRLLAAAALGLVLAALAAVVTLAVRASMARSARIIAVLRQVGARDRMILRVFTRRFTLYAGGGAALGVAAGLAGLALLPPAAGALPLLSGPAFAGAGWTGPLLLPLLSALIAWIATRHAAARLLGDLT